MSNQFQPSKREFHEAQPTIFTHTWKQAVWLVAVLHERIRPYDLFYNFLFSFNNVPRRFSMSGTRTLSDSFLAAIRCSLLRRLHVSLNHSFLEGCGTFPVLPVVNYAAVSILTHSCLPTGSSFRWGRGWEHRGPERKGQE